MLRPIVCLSSTCVLLLSSIVFSQTTPSSQHTHKALVISGKDHPELIPDVTAYSLVLSVLSVPTNATDQDRAARAAHVNQIGLDFHDTLQLTAIVDGFRKQHDEMVKRFNDSIIPFPAGPASMPDTVGAEQSRQALVLKTVEQIKSGLSPEGVKLFLTHVQAEKAHMAVSGGAQ